MTRRIVQIAACGVDNVSSTQCAYITTALCDDGTLWEQRNTSSDWRCFSPIPDAPILAEAPSASANTESDAISALREEVAELRKEVARHRSFVGMHTPLGGDSARF
jgi:hypothetical protein